jgi:hypothetical protein
VAGLDSSSFFQLMACPNLCAVWWWMRNGDVVTCCCVVGNFCAHVLFKHTMPAGLLGLLTGADPLTRKEPLPKPQHSNWILLFAHPL